MWLSRRLWRYWEGWNLQGQASWEEAGPQGAPLRGDGDPSPCLSLSVLRGFHEMPALPRGALRQASSDRPSDHGRAPWSCDQNRPVLLISGLPLVFRHMEGTWTHSHLLQGDAVSQSLPCRAAPLRGQLGRSRRSHLDRKPRGWWAGTS